MTEFGRITNFFLNYDKRDDYMSEPPQCDKKW